MRWFKHLTASRTDPDIGTIIDRFGYKGYFMFFRTLEIISDEFDIENPGKITKNFKWFLEQFPRNIDKKTLVNFYNFCQNSLEKKRIIYTLNGKNIELNFPKLKDLTDDYTSRVLRSESEVNPNNVRSESEKSSSYRNKNKEIRNKNEEEELCPNTKYSDVDIELSSLLIEGILKNNPRAKAGKLTEKQKESWHNQCRLLRESGWSPDEIRTVIQFCLQDDFEMANVLSMGKLRERFDNLALKARREIAKKTGERDVGRQKEGI